MAAAPGLADLAEIQIANFSNVPSDYLGPEEWARLSRYVRELTADPAVAGVVITHGTDTLEETAFFLDITVPGDKPVVFVGAQRTASVWDSDGPRNLLAAVRVAVSPAARGLGTLAVVGRTINPARDATKIHTSSLEAFGSGDHGPIGYVDEDRVVISRRPIRAPMLPLGERLARVDIIPMYGGADATFVHAAIAAGAQGLVIQALGRGNVNEALYEGVVEAIQRGLPVVVSTRVPAGRTLPVYDFRGGGRTLVDAGAVFSGDLNPQKARVLLLVALRRAPHPGRDPPHFRVLQLPSDSLGPERRRRSRRQDGWAPPPRRAVTAIRQV